VQISILKAECDHRYRLLLKAGIARKPTKELGAGVAEGTLWVGQYRETKIYQIATWENDRVT